MSLLSRVPFRLTRALLLPGLGLANLTLSAALALAGTHEHVLRVDPGAANRDLTLDTAAQNAGQSLNTWIVQALRRATTPDNTSHHSSRRISGWA